MQSKWRKEEINILVNVLTHSLAKSSMIRLITLSCKYAEHEATAAG